MVQADSSRSICCGQQNEPMELEQYGCLPSRAVPAVGQTHTYGKPRGLYCISIVVDRQTDATSSTDATAVATGAWVARQLQVLLLIVARQRGREWMDETDVIVYSRCTATGRNSRKRKCVVYVGRSRWDFADASVTSCDEADRSRY